MLCVEHMHGKNQSMEVNFRYLIVGNWYFSVHRIWTSITWYRYWLLNIGLDLAVYQPVNSIMHYAV